MGVEESGSCIAAKREFEDVWMSKCLQHLGIYPVNTLNTRKQLRWSPYTLRQKEDWNLRKFEKGHYTKGDADGWYFGNRVEGSPRGADCCDEHMIALHWYKIEDNEEQMKVYQELDSVFRSDKMKDIPIPPQPTTFLFGGRQFKNKELEYRHQ